MIWTFTRCLPFSVSWLLHNIVYAEINECPFHAVMFCLGDTVEANAIKSIFSDHATSGALALSSTKVILGLKC